MSEFSAERGSTVSCQAVPARGAAATAGELAFCFLKHRELRLGDCFTRAYLFVANVPHMLNVVSMRAFAYGRLPPASSIAQTLAAVDFVHCRATKVSSNTAEKTETMA